MRVDDIASSELGQVDRVSQVGQIVDRFGSVSRGSSGPVGGVEISFLVVERDSGLSGLE